MTEEFDKAPNADYLYEEMQKISQEEKAQIELRASKDTIFAKIKKTGEIIKFIIGGVSPNYVEKTIKNKISKT